MQCKTQTEWRITRLITFAAVALLLVGLHLTSITARAQIKKPISKEGLIKAIQLNGLSTQELVQQIGQRGVAFQVTPAVEAEMRAAGARPEVISAARTNYRPAVTSAGRPSTPGKPTPNVPPGAPLSKNEVVTLLQSGVAPARVEQFVQVRCVNFKINQQISREITTAGGTRSLIGSITSACSTPTSASTRPMPRSGPDYDDLIDQATAAIQANNANGAIRFLRQAINQDASRPTAHALLGYAELYGNKNIGAAEGPMRMAVERGGAAVFRVFHDHSNGTFDNTCAGSLFVTKSGVTFKADDGKDTFGADDPNIAEIKVNRLAGRGAILGIPTLGLGSKDRGAFHIKVKGGRNYNFAPLTEQKAESNLIITLARAYQ